MTEGNVLLSKTCINRSPLHMVFKWHHGGNTKNSRTITALQVWCMNVFREDMKTSSSHNSNLSFNNYDIRWPFVCQCLSVLEARCLHHVIPPPCNPSGSGKCCTLNAHRPCSPWPRLMSQFTAWQFDCTEIWPALDVLGYFMSDDILNGLIYFVLMSPKTLWFLGIAPVVGQNTKLKKEPAFSYECN